MDRNYLIDLALSIANDGADEYHTKEELSGKETELESMDPEEMQAIIAQTKAEIEELKKDFVDGAVLRRAKTDYLASKSPAYDYHQRCHLKHRGTAWIQAVETYLADPNDTTYSLMVQSEKRYFGTLAKFMGVNDIPNCGRCLSDELNRLSGDLIK